MARRFKNVLCLAFMPDAYGFKTGNHWRSCHRHGDHKGPHRCQGVWEWDDGDIESRRVKKRA